MALRWPAGAIPAYPQRSITIRDPMTPDKLQTGITVRQACRRGAWTSPTPALAPGFAQANLVIVPQEFAFDFLLFCQRNPRPCPLLSVTDAGEFQIGELAAGADLRTDLPRYRVWQQGRLVDEPTDVLGLWRNDFVSFLIGCSFTFDTALLRAGLPVRHIEQNRNVPMYTTSIPCRRAGVFGGPLVVSMRPLTPQQAQQATGITRRYPHFHGEPVHRGDPRQIGIENLARPDFGDAVTVRDGEVPVFWACGVTPQCALMQARLPIAITHAPGHMFVTDRTDAALLDRPSDL
jgi:uncharacterized protein YcsI (UPF0317 family)